MPQFTEEDLPGADNGKGAMATAFAEALAKLIGSGAAIGPVRGAFGGSVGPVRGMADAGNQAADNVQIPQDAALTDPAPNRGDRTGDSAPTADSQPPPPPVKPNPPQFGLFVPPRPGTGTTDYTPPNIPPVAQPQADGGPGLPPQGPKEPMKNYIDQFNSKMSLADAFKLAAIPLGTTLMGGFMGGNRGALAGAVEGFKAIKGEKSDPKSVNKNRFEPLKSINPQTGQAEWVFLDREKGIIVKGDGTPTAMYSDKIFENNPKSSFPGQETPAPAPETPATGQTGPASGREAPPADDKSNPAFVAPKTGQAPAPGQAKGLPGVKGDNANGMIVQPNDAITAIAAMYDKSLTAARDAKDQAHQEAAIGRKQGESLEDTAKRKAAAVKREEEIDKEIAHLSEAEIAAKDKVLSEGRTFENQKALHKLTAELAFENGKELENLRAGHASTRAAEAAGARQSKDDKKTGDTFSDDLNASRGRAGEFGKIQHRINAADYALGLLLDKKTGKPRALSSGELTEAGAAIGALVNSGGVAAQHTIEEMAPKTLAGDFNKQWSYVTGNLKTTEIPSFVGRMAETAKREKEIAQGQIFDAQKQIVAKNHAWRLNHPDDWTRKLKAAGLNPEDFNSESLYIEKTPGNKAKTVKMRSPTGKFYDVPLDQVQRSKTEGKWEEVK